jgi:hypothetical protein
MNTSAIFDQKQTFADQLSIVVQDLRTPWFNLHRIFDELPMTVWAFRVYAHLVRRGGEENRAIPGYQSIGEKCFRASMPDAKPETLRRKAIHAVNELVGFGLIKVTHQVVNGNGDRAIKPDDGPTAQGERQTSNLFQLTHCSDWNPDYHPGEDAKNYNCSMFKSSREALRSGSRITPPVIPDHPPSDPGSPEGKPDIRETQFKKEIHDQTAKNGFVQGKPERVCADEMPDRKQPSIEQPSLLGKPNQETPPPTPSPNAKKSRDNNSELDAEFETDFWPLAIRKVGKGAARKAYRAARRKGASKDLLVQRFAKANQGWKEQKTQGMEVRFIPHPSTWLNGERWEDADLQGAEGPTGNEMTLEEGFKLFCELKALYGWKIKFLKRVNRSFSYEVEGLPGRELFNLDHLPYVIRTATNKFGAHQVTPIVEKYTHTC